MVDWNDGRVVCMIICLIISLGIIIFAYFVPEPKAEVFGNYSINPTESQQAIPRITKEVTPIFIFLSIPLIYLLYREFKPKKEFNIRR